MDEPLSTEPYKGVRDFYPAGWSRLSGMFENIRQTLLTWGYEEYNASPLERAELYEAKTSEEIVSEQTYTFTDRGDRRVTLRPEMTPTLARMVAAKRRELPMPLRWFSIGNRFRYERPQKGRLREFYQIDVDIIGVPEGEADIEVVKIVSEVFKAFGANEKDFTIRINSRALLDAACKAAGLTGDAARQYVRLLDKKAKMTPEAFSSASSAISAKDPLSFLDPKPIEALVAALNTRGVGNVVFDPGITRGFDYYTGMVFEVFDTSPENPRALFGGGRYDGLMSLFGGEPVPAVGFAIGEVSFGDFLETHQLASKLGAEAAHLYLGTPSEADIPAAQAFAETLRKSGAHVFVNLSARSLGDQIKDAVKRGIPHFAAYGSEEAASKSLRLKTLSTGEEETVSAADIGARLTNGK